MMLVGRAIRGVRRRSAAWWLLGIVVVGVAARYGTLEARSLWFDEAFSWRLIQFSYSEMLARAAADVHPPLYYVLLKAWSVVFGSGLIALRSFSVTFGALTLALAYVLAATISRSRATGLLAALLLAVSGWQIQFAQEARMYTLGTALAVTSTWLLVRAIRSERAALGWWLGYAVATAAFAYVHYYAFFTIAAQLLFLAGYVVMSTRGRIGEMLQWRLVWYSVLAIGVMIGLYAPWIPVLWRQLGQVQAVFWIPELTWWSLPDTFYRMFVPTANGPSHEGMVVALLTLLPLALTVAGWAWLVLGKKKKDASGLGAGWLLVLLGALPFIFSIGLSWLGQSLYQDRFLVFAHVFIVLGAAQLLGRIPWLVWRAALAGAAVVGLVAAQVSYWRELDVADKPGTRGAVRAVMADRGEVAPIVVSSPFVFFPVDHYVREEFEGVAPVKLYSESGELVHFAGAPILETADIVGPAFFNASETPAVWVVDTTGFGGSALPLPSGWRNVSQQKFPEVFGYQGEIIVSRYARQ